MENFTQLEPKMKIPTWDNLMQAGTGQWQYDLLLPLEVCQAIHTKTAKRMVTLRTKNGDCKVKLIRHGPYPNLLLSTGWNEFVKENGVRQGDWLQFVNIQHLHSDVFLQVRVKEEVEPHYVDDVDMKTSYFEKLMVPALRSKRGQLNILILFMRANNIFKSTFQSVTLKDPDGKIWQIKLNGDRKGQPKQRMRKGWNVFYEGNNLKTTTSVPSS